MDVASTAIGSSGSSEPPPSDDAARCQATPPSSRASVTRSATESKKAPRGDAVPDALATAPSSRSGSAARTSRQNPTNRWPVPTAAAVPAAMTRPRPVRWSAVMPVRRRAEPTGRMPCSTLVRQRPSNIRSGLPSVRVRPPSRYRRGSLTCGNPDPSRSNRSTRGTQVKSFPPAKIRNVALVGHGGSGKTSLAEALLFTSGTINRQGRTEDGTTTSDFDPEEVKRHISLSTSLLPFECNGHKINLFDAPGYADFLPEVEAALRVADLAVFVVSAVEGVEVQTEIIWSIAERLNLPRMIFVNKEDRERASFERVLE